MIKYLTYKVVFEEIPDKVTLAVNITNCQNHCIGCHSPELLRNIGTELSFNEIDSLIEKNKGIDCFCFMGEGNDPIELIKNAEYIKENYKNISLAIYSGRDNVEGEIFNIFDYVKVGKYDENYGALNKESTNQRLYYCNHKTEERIDITDKFWKKNSVQ